MIIKIKQADDFGEVHYSVFLHLASPFVFVTKPCNGRKKKQVKVYVFLGLFFS